MKSNDKKEIGVGDVVEDEEGVLMVVEKVWKDGELSCVWRDNMSRPHEKRISKNAVTKRM